MAIQANNNIFLNTQTQKRIKVISPENSAFTLNIEKLHFSQNNTKITTFHEFKQSTNNQSEDITLNNIDKTKLRQKPFKERFRIK